MNILKTTLFLSFFLCCAAGWGKTVGLWHDARSQITDGMLKTLQEDGWQTIILKGKDLSDDSKLAGLDALFLPGGWNAINFADFNARRSLVKYAAGGGGILAGAFRSGYVRTGNRPIFPQVGATFNRVNGPYVSAFGDSELAKAIDKPFCPGGWDHLVVKVGPLGKVFAVSGDDPVAVYGEVYGGRYLIFGAFIGMDAVSNAMQGTERRVLLKCVEWLAAAPKLSDSEKAKRQSEADKDFLRREALWNWTLNERGPDSGPGLIPGLRNSMAIALESRMLMLQYMSDFVPEAKRGAAKSEISALARDLARLNANAEKETEKARSRIARMSIDELLADKPAESKGAVAERLLPAERLATVKKRADALIGELRPLLRKAKAERLAAERRADSGKVPGLIAGAASTNAAERLDAVRELGRIGDPKSAKALVAALSDGNENVRVEAILGLGWMQSKEAVPALLGLLGSADVRVKSRAIQALGQIGDARAEKAIVALLRDPHPFIAENAIMSAGWLKARSAVPVLLKILSENDARIGEQRGRMTTALRALGHIGDASALPPLEALAASTNDFPRTRRPGGAAIANIYATPQGLGLKRHSELAIAGIKAGGRAEPGVSQPDFLSSKDSYYALTRNHNALAGRAMGILMPPSFKEDGNTLLPYLVEAGFTGVHNAWGDQDADPDQYARLVEAAGDLGLIWIDVLPVNTFPYRAPYYGDNPQSGVEKASGDLVLAKLRDMPAFVGFWSEETYPGIKATAGDFYEWLTKKYGPDFRAKLGLGADFVLPPKDARFRESMAESMNASTDCLEFGAERILDYWGETQDWLRGLRKGCVFTFSVSGSHFASYIGLTGPAGDTITVNGPETYQCFGRDNAFLMEMYKDGEARPVMCEFYNWYTPSPAHEIRGFAQHLMHGECFYNFALEHIFKYNTGANWTWDATRWDSFRAIFQKAAGIREYLAIPESAANVAQLCSESTACMFDEASSLGGRWLQHQSSLWTALQQSQVPADVIWAETLSPKKLARYKVLVMADVKMLSDAQAGMVRDWVNKGGVLIAGGSSTLFDRKPAPRKNYLLADVFGADYAGFAGVTKPAENDTMRFKHGALPAPVESSMDRPGVQHHVLRGIKPVKSIGTYKTAAAATPLLPGIGPETACEYDMPLGYDKVKPGSAETLARFANGDPALIANRFGEGLCYFWTPIYPGLCHVDSEWEMAPNRKDFWPNVRELLAAMVAGGLAFRNAALPAEITGVGLETEVTLRSQPGHNRMMVHLLNYDARLPLVKAPRLAVNPDAGKTVKSIFYPDTKTAVKFTAGNGGVTALLRDFEVHDMLVVEWE
ncbi:MAG: hypothetical protein GX608_12815 [Lentisphaerae bacterium]|nr:hypothetical protein [Lentisphaerota bacterium]